MQEKIMESSRREKLESFLNGLADSSVEELTSFPPRLLEEVRDRVCEATSHAGRFTCTSTSPAIRQDVIRQKTSQPDVHHPLSTTSSKPRRTILQPDAHNPRPTASFTQPNVPESPSTASSKPRRTTSQLDPQVILNKSPSLMNLFNVGSRDWRVIWQLNQRWVKNNRDPENVVFGTAHKEHEKFIYNETGFLLCMALADGALFGVESVDDLQKKEIPPGENELILRYNESTLKKPILRRCTKAGGVTDDLMPKSAFSEIWRSNTSNAGYFYTPTIHSIRRGLGKKVDKNYTPVQRGQHLTQADPAVFGQSYVANCSSVDGQGTFLEEASDHRHIDYFQSVDRFLEPGLPSELPARLQDELNHDERLCELQEKANSLVRDETARADVSEARRRLANYRRKLHSQALRAYQKRWVRERRDWKILTGGKKQAHDSNDADLVRHLCLLIPERGRLAQRMSQDEPLSPHSMWQAVRDLYSLCIRDFTVLYLPGLDPLEGRCHVKSCRKSVDSLPKNRRNDHIQACVRQEMATKLERLPSEIHYCYLCFRWVVGEKEWELHCTTHTSSLTKRCGTLSHCYTLVRPAYCPFHIGNHKLPAARRLQSWDRDFDLWKHVNNEIKGCHWPMACPHPLCDILLEDDLDLQFHFIDDHGFSHTRPSQSVGTGEPDGHGQSAKTTADRTLGKCKRKAPSIDDTIAWEPLEFVPPSIRTERSDSRRSPKKIRCTNPTISPPLLSAVNQIDIRPKDDSDASLLPLAEDKTVVDLLNTESECDPSDILRECDRKPDDDRSMDDDQTSCATGNNLFSPFINSRFSSVSPAGVPGACGRGTMPAKDDRDSRSPSEDVDKDSGLCMLFDQFLRSPSPDLRSPDDMSGEFNGTTLVNGGHNQFRAGRQPLKGAAIERMTEGKAALCQESLHRTTNVPRIRLPLQCLVVGQQGFRRC